MLVGLSDVVSCTREMLLFDWGRCTAHRLGAELFHFEVNYGTKIVYGRSKSTCGSYKILPPQSRPSARRNWYEFCNVRVFYISMHAILDQSGQCCRCRAFSSSLQMACSSPPTYISPCVFQKPHYTRGYMEAVQYEPYRLIGYAGTNVFVTGYIIQYARVRACSEGDNSSEQSASTYRPSAFHSVQQTSPCTYTVKPDDLRTHNPLRTMNRLAASDLA